MKKGFKDLLIEELHDLLSAERQIIVSLPKLVMAAESADLREAFRTHLQETKGQVQRLDKIFRLLKTPKKAKTCKAMKGLIQECSEVLKEFKTKSPLRDAALISKAQRIEHYEIAAYGTLRTFSKELELDEVSDLLQESLDEEGNADKKMTKIAEGGLFRTGINQQAISEEEAKMTKRKPTRKVVKHRAHPKITKRAHSRKFKRTSVSRRVVAVHR